MEKERKMIPNELKEKFSQLLVKSAYHGGGTTEQIEAANQFALAFALPLREAIFSGDIIGGLFSSFPLSPGETPRYPTDLISPGTERDFVAYTCPSPGRIPFRHVESDYIMLHTYRIANSIDWDIRYSQVANWNIIQRAMQVYEAGVVKKMNNDGWHTILAAAASRNIMVFDTNAAAGQFTKRLVSLIKTTMQRNGGGNSTSLGRTEATDVYTSPEAIEDMRDWNIDQVDEITRREIYMTPDGTIPRIFGVNIHSLDELGVGQEYQLYFTGTLGGSLASSDEELVVAVDRTKGTLIMPTVGEFETFDDPMMHRWQRQGVYGWGEMGFASLDNRHLIVGSF